MPYGFQYPQMGPQRISRVPTGTVPGLNTSVGFGDQIANFLGIGGNTINTYLPYAAGAGAIGSLLTARGGRQGQTFGGILSGAGTGASIGSIFGPIGTGIGAGLGALIGGITGASSETPEEANQRRLGDYLKELSATKQKTLTEGIRTLSTYTGNLTNRFRSNAARQAIAMGRVSDTQALETPVAERATALGVETMGRFVSDTTRAFDTAELNARENYAFNTPLTPTASDYLREMAPAAVDFGFRNQQFKLLQDFYTSNQGGGSLFGLLQHSGHGGT